MQFAEIVGQRQLINSLIKTVEEGRVPHAQLFAGAEGNGTFALVLAYSQFISCQNKQFYNTDSENELRADSCGKCPSCLKYKRLAHPDLHFVFPNTTTKKVDKNNESALFMDLFREFVEEKQGYIDINSWLEYLKAENKQGEINVRDANTIIKDLTMTSYESPYKVMIIWCADRLRHDAAPKLLKIIEEPYDRTLFFLISENTDAVLSTIVSRTQLVKVLPIEKDCLQEFLVQKKGMSVSEVEIRVKNSEGNLLKALNYDNQTNKDFIDMFITWTRLAFRYDKKAMDIIPFSESLAKMGKEKQRTFLLSASNLFRECLMCALNIPIESEILTGENLDFKKKFSKFLNYENVNRIFALLKQADFHITRNANAKILFFDLTLQIGRQLSLNK